MRCMISWRTGKAAARAGALLLLLLAGMAAARAATVELFAPRPFGYFIGDLITHEAVLTLDPGYRIEASALPRPRPVTYWLDLVSARLTELPEQAGGRRYRLTLAYQTFYAPLEPRALDIPAVPLVAIDGDKRLALSVPAWTFVSAPLREIASSRAANPMALQADLAPPPYPLGRDLRLAGGAAGLAAACLLALAVLRGWGPFATRRMPFSRAMPRLRRTLAGPDPAAAYAAGLVLLHRAFDAAAGRRLLAEDVPAFLAGAPQFAGEADAIARFFTASRMVFFGTDAEQARALLPADALVALSRRLAAAERNGARQPRAAAVAALGGAS